MKTTLFLFVSILLTFCAHGQIITTIAGSSGTLLGDGGPATNSSFIGPYDVALDGKGNYYITDGYHDRIRKIDASGIITTIVGNPLATVPGDGGQSDSARLNKPTGVALDTAGNFYIADGSL